MTVDSTGPIADLRVVELADGVATAFATKVLADLGAQVVMVEPPEGHLLRTAEPRGSNGVGARFVYLSAGKQSMVVNSDEGGDRGLADLLAAADLLVTDRDPVQVAALVSTLPRLAVVTVRPFGATGPKAEHRAHHLTVFHASGESSTMPSGLGWELFPDRAPLQLGSEMGWFDAGWNAAIAALAACYDARRAPDAQRVDVSVQESLLTLNRTRLNRLLNEGVNVERERNRYGIYGMLQCADGWVQLVGVREEHWDRLVTMADGAEFAALGFGTASQRAEDLSGLGKALAEWCLARPKHDVARIMSGLGAPAGVLADAADVLASEQLAHRGFFRDVDDGHGDTLRVPGAPYRFSERRLPVRGAPVLGSSTGVFEPRAAVPDVAVTRPGRLLEGVRVLDFTWAAAGPYATLLLALLGADVIKVESSRRLDPARNGFLARYDGVDHSPIFNELNLNKRSIQLDLTQPESLAIVTQLLAEVDVVVDNFRPGVMDRLGLGADALLTANPRLVVASSSANGATGPEAMGAGLASIFAATGGLSVQTGYDDGPPTEVGDPVDYRSGAALVVGVLAGLLDRDRTGQGQHVDLSSREVVIASGPDALLAHAAGTAWQPRVGNRHRTLAPHDVYPCADGWVAVAVADDAEWRALCDVLQRPEWVAELATASARHQAGDAIDAVVAAWTRQHSAGSAADRLQAAGVAAAPVMTFAALADDPHLLARNAFVSVEHPVLGRQVVLRPPWLFSAGGGGIRQAAPLLGGDTMAVVTDLDGVPPVSEERQAVVFR